MTGQYKKSKILCLVNYVRICQKYDASDIADPGVIESVPEYMGFKSSLVIMARDNNMLIQMIRCLMSQRKISKRSFSVDC